MIESKEEVSKIDQYVIDYVLQLRKKHDLTQDDIATIIGVGRTYVTNIENPNDRSKYNLSHINLLADHFGISPRDFLPEKPLL